MNDLPDDHIPNQIIPMILDKIITYLGVALIDGVPEGSPTRAILVKAGKFQDNPLNKNVSVAVSGGNSEDPDFIDGRVDHQELDTIVIRNIPVGEIGGGDYWWRRFTCQYHTFFVRQRFDEDRAMKYAYDFQGRLMKAIRNAPIKGLTDDYGELASNWPILESSTFFESGGNNQFIWRGKLFFRVLTWRP